MVEIEEFWQFAFGDLQNASVRAGLGFFLVCRALGLGPESRQPTGQYDVLDHGLLITVKTGGLRQSGNIERSTPITFSGLRKKAHSAIRNASEPAKGCFVLAVQGTKAAQHAANALDETTWKFFLIPFDTVIQNGWDVLRIDGLGSEIVQVGYEQLFTSIAALRRDRYSINR